VIYAIDPGGLRYYGLTAADDASQSDPQTLNTLAISRSQEEYDSREGMVLLAHATGGLFLKNTNDIDGALRQAMQDSAGYSLLGYQPDASTFDARSGQPRFHGLKVRVKTAGLRVRSRSGFFGVADSGPATTGQTPREQILSALASPFSSGDIHVRVTVLFKDEAKGGPVLDVLLFIDARELLFEAQPDGTRKASFDAAAATFDENGTPVESTLRTFNVVAKEADLPALGRAGIVYVLEHPAKKAGPYQVRVAIRDGASSRIGSASQFIEVPEVRKGHLALSSVLLTQDSFGLTGSSSAKAGKAQRTSPAVRVFQPGATVLYVYQVLNAKTDSAGHADLEAQVRVFRNGEEIYTGRATPAVMQGDGAKDHLLCAGAIALGPKMTSGDYVLQVAVTDKLAKSKHALAAEAMDFEVRP